MQERRPVMLVILDGFGWREDAADNAVLQARTPTFHRLWESGPHGFLHTSGEAVGLPAGQMGNSEVGHLNIGAGRVVMQDLPRIGGAIARGEIKQAPALTDLIEKLKDSGGTCHLIGLISPGGVHSHQDHAVALAKILDEAGVPTLVHAITDGRDTPPQSAAQDIDRLLAALPKSVSIATVCGRYYAMDRDKRWERVAKAYNAIVEAEGPRFADAQAVIADAYANKKFDEFILPAVVGDYRGMQDGDGVLCFNFPADRVREILGAILDKDFSGFARQRAVRLVAAVGMTAIQRRRSTAHGGDLSRRRRSRTSWARWWRTPAAPSCAWRRPRSIRTSPTSSTAAARSPIRARTASWCRRPRSRPTTCNPKCRRRSSPTRRWQAIDSGKYDLIVLNYANPDMVGHTGNLAAAIKAVETVDTGLGRIVEAIEQSRRRAAGHRRPRQLRADARPETGGPHTAHTTNPVPVVLVGATIAPWWRKAASPTSRRPCSS